MTTPRRPPGRYDEPRALPSRPVLLTVGAVLAALLLAVAYGVFAKLSGGPGAAVLGFKVVSESAVDVQVEVHRKQGSTVFCLVRARAEDGAEVGRGEVSVPRHGGSTVRLTYRLTTTRRATTGEVGACSTRP